MASNNFDGAVLIDNGISTPLLVNGYFGFGRAPKGVVSTGPRIIAFTASPNGITTAPTGSIGLVQDGTFWVNQGGTVWTDVTATIGVVGNIVVWQPGGVAGGSIFTTWAMALAAAQTTVASAGVCYFYVDTHLGAAVIPAGAYDLNNIVWSGIPSQLLTQTDVTLAAGVTFTNWNTIGAGLGFIANNTAAPVYIPVDQSNFIMDHARLFNNGTQPFVRVAAGRTLYVTMRNESLVSILGATATIDCAANANLSVLADGHSQVDSNTISGVASAALDLENYDSASIISLTQAAFSGTGLSHVLLPDARYEGYTPAVPGNWSVVPVQVAEALDRLAASALTIVTRSVVASGSITTADQYLLVNTSVARSLGLPNPATKQVYIVKDVTGSAETNPITITRFGTETIEGLASSYTCQTNFGVWRFTSDGTNWWLT